MNDELSRLASRIRDYLSEIDSVLQRIEEGWKRFRSSNVYTFRFDPQKIGRLVEKAPEMFNRVRAELRAFSDFLEESAAA